MITDSHSRMHLKTRERRYMAKYDKGAVGRKRRERTKEGGWEMEEKKVTVNSFTLSMAAPFSTFIGLWAVNRDLR